MESIQGKSQSRCEGPGQDVLGTGYESWCPGESAHDVERWQHPGAFRAMRCTKFTMAGKCRQKFQCSEVERMRSNRPKRLRRSSL